MLLRIYTIILLTCFYTLVYAAPPSDTLTVIIKNIGSRKGQLRTELFNQSINALLSKNNPLQTIITKGPDSIVIIKFTDVPKGYYAIATWHDKNQNGKLDHLFIALPSERYGYSNNVRGKYGAPSFKKINFYYSGADTTMIVYLGDYFSNPTDNDSLLYKNSWVGAPFAGYTPETRALVGLTVARVFRFKGEGNRSSLVDLFGIYTQQKQTIIEQNYTLFSAHDNWMGLGYSKFQKYPQYYFGVGNQLPLGNRELISYNELKLEHALLRRITGKLFAGAGFRYVNLFNVKQPANGILTTEQPAGYRGYRVVGLTFALSLDTRDNVYNSVKGHLVRLKYNVHERLWGSQYTFSTYEIDLRKFIKISRSRRDVVALQFYDLSTTGNTVWNEMGALGSDNIMRGYYSGRYRDKNYAAMQAEYRLYLNKMIGLVAFVAFGEVAPTIAAYSVLGLKPSYGGGLRIRIDNREKLNLRLDYGVGLHTSNFYITIAEAF